MTNHRHPRSTAVLLGLAGLLATAPAHARRLPTSLAQLDLESDAWVLGGVEAGTVYGNEFGGMTLSVHVPLLPSLALRGQQSLSFVSLGSNDERHWRVRRSWWGPEAYRGWKLGEGHFRLGASAEAGAPTFGDGLELSMNVPFDDPRFDGWALRVRGGARLEGHAGSVQVEAVNVSAVPGHSGEYHAVYGPRETFVYPRSSPTSWFDGSKSFIMASGALRVDDRRSLAFDAVYSSDEIFWFSASYWASLWGDATRARSSLGVRVASGQGVFALGVSLLYRL